MLVFFCQQGATSCHFFILCFGILAGIPFGLQAEVPEVIPTIQPFNQRMDFYEWVSLSAQLLQAVIGFVEIL